MNGVKIGCTFLIWLCCVVAIGANDIRQNRDTTLAGRVFAYVEGQKEQVQTTKRYTTYTRFQIDIQRRNVLLMAVPSLFEIGRTRKRHFMGEMYDSVYVSTDTRVSIKNIKRATTVPHGEKAFPFMEDVLNLQMYHASWYDGYFHSPFVASNARLYHFEQRIITPQLACLWFKPLRKNTRLVSGWVMVVPTSGRILSGMLKGEYDMQTFELEFTMPHPGEDVGVPQSCKLHFDFRFMGNHVSGAYISESLVNQKVDTVAVANSSGFHSFTYLRTFPLNATDEMFLPIERKVVEIPVDTTLNLVRRRPSWKYVLWDKVGKNLFNPFQTSVGKKKKGFFKVNPLFNPLYMGYTPGSGFIYKTGLRLGYTLSPEMGFEMRLNAGYSFKQRQFYYEIPVTYTFSKRKQGNVQLWIANGNRISSNTFEESLPDNVIAQALLSGFDISNFKDNSVKLQAHLDLMPRLGISIGGVYHRRIPLDKNGFRALNLPIEYRSLAPFVAFTCQPFDSKGPVYSLLYERSFKNAAQSNIAYERWELDCQYLITLPRLRSFSFRAGSGFYTQRYRDSYFLDYTNFRQETLPGGWNDEWTGGFELLSRSEYNRSSYYIRSNVTYESTTMLAARLPYLGRFFEKERLYTGILWTSSLHPYIECGYGFTTRWLSLGVFVGNKQGRFSGIGCRFALELFRRWV